MGLALAFRPVIDRQNARGRPAWQRQLADQAQQGIQTDRHALLRQACPGFTAQCYPNGRSVCVSGTVRI